MTVTSALSCSNSLLSNSKHKKHGRKAVRPACAGGICDAFRGSICFSLALERISICRLPVRAVAWRARPLGVVCTAASACRGIVSCWMTVVHGTELGDAASLAARGQAKQKMCALSET